MSQARVANFCPRCGAALEQQEREGRLRPVCPACGYVVYFDPKVAVAVFITQRDQVLLVQRKINPMAGCWALPAGFMDYDEDPQTAARREVLEETNLEIVIDRLLEIFHTPDDGGMADIVIAYAAHITGGSLRAQDDAAQVAWFSREQVPEVAFLPSQTIVQRWLAGAL